LYIRHSAYHKALRETQVKLKATLHARENALQKATLRLNELQHEKNYREWADLLMANLHSVNKGDTTVKLPNYYDNGKYVELKLKRERSAAQNAAFYYSKAKNQRKEVEQLELSIARWKRDVAELESQRQQLLEAKDLTSSKTFIASLREGPTDMAKETDNLFHRYEHMGYVILVGKNAKNNDLLTTRHAYKEDLWFHVRDAPGSHVLVKHQAGKQYPRSVITYAAQLAAYYSKRRLEHTCPVVFTPRKFVRKRKGDSAGAVVLDRERTLLVTPGLVPGD
jgi:predicted ribosome quality control (RQC) complex YloA/Tae2 family protein